jgi:hypothetical protein
VPGMYPLPERRVDQLFTDEVVESVAKALESHGFPPIRSGSDTRRLADALKMFLYGQQLFADHWVHCEQLADDTLRVFCRDCDFSAVAADYEEYWTMRKRHLASAL